MEKDLKRDSAKLLIEARKASLKRMNPDRRMKWVGSARGVNFLLDNFGFDLLESLKSIKQLKGSIIWVFSNPQIAKYYSDFSGVVSERVKAAIALNRTSDDLLHLFRGDVDFFADAKSVAIAVNTAYALAEPGDLVMFSPGEDTGIHYGSWEEFTDSFEKEVKKLVE